jgi:hypothetical protein
VVPLPSQTATTVEQAIRTGADPADQATWLRYWQLQVAGSDVHQTARDATLQVARDTTTGGRVMRIAEPGACDWCRAAASRGPVYHSEATALAVSHGHCRCDIVTVPTRAAITAIRDAGAEAWQQSGLADQTNPFGTRTRGPRSSIKPDPAVFLPGAQTPERAASIRALLAGYQDTIAAGHGTDWMGTQVTRLHTELESLTLGRPAASMASTPGVPPTMETARAAVAEARRIAESDLDAVQAVKLRVEPGPVTIGAAAEYFLGGGLRVGTINEDTAFAVLHEPGHAVGDQVLGTAGSYATATELPVLAPWRASLEASVHYQETADRICPDRTVVLTPFAGRGCSPGLSPNVSRRGQGTTRCWTLSHPGSRHSSTGHHGTSS